MAAFFEHLLCFGAPISGLMLAGLGLLQIMDGRQSGNSRKTQNGTAMLLVGIGVILLGIVGGLWLAGEL